MMGCARNFTNIYISIICLFLHGGKGHLFQLIYKLLRFLIELSSGDVALPNKLEWGVQKEMLFENYPAVGFSRISLNFGSKILFDRRFLTEVAEL